MTPTEQQEANPLLQPLYLPDDLADVARCLTFDPLRGINPAAMTLMSRLDLLNADKVPLTPTMNSLRIAATIVTMIRSSYRARNPCSAQGRRFVNQSIQSAYTAYSGPPMLGTSVFVIKGVTGVAKTVTVKHTLRMLGPQVVVHQERPDAMWRHATQITWLMVPMSHDGSRGGLLNNVLLAVDAALGSDRGTRLVKQYRTVERLAGAVIALLHSLYVGALVIDEIQLGNLVQAEQAHKMHLFLLNLINSGIPVILIGNPAGFSWLSRLSQDATRLSSIPQMFVHPACSVEEADDWEAVFDGVSAYYVMSEPPTDSGECRRALQTRSGGIARCALTLWCNAQRQALEDGRTRISATDIEAAYRSEAFDVVRDLCDGFARKDIVPLMQWADSDVPVDYYAKRWKVASPSLRSASVAPPMTRESAPARKARSPRLSQSQMLAEEGRAVRRGQIRKELAATLEPDDMRAEGIKQHTLRAFNELLATTEDTASSR